MFLIVEFFRYIFDAYIDHPEEEGRERTHRANANSQSSAPNAQTVSLMEKTGQRIIVDFISGLGGICEPATSCHLQETPSDLGARVEVVQRLCSAR